MADRSNPSQWVVCPACHQRAGMMSDASSNTYECEQCGHTWRAADSPESTSSVKKPPRNHRATPRIFN